MTGRTLRSVDELLVPFRTPTAAPPAIRHAIPTRHQPDDSWWHEPEWACHLCCEP